jgi:peptidoglycan/LPS O-acetylase OafA/YrhL
VVTGITGYRSGPSVTPTTWTPEPALVAYYGLFFAVGWLLHRRAEAVRRLPTVIAPHVVLAAATFILFLLTIQRATLERPAHVTEAAARGVFTWAATFVFLGLFIRWFTSKSRVIGYLADASYWTYLVHLPFVVLAQHAILPLDAGADVKVVVVLSATLAVCLVTYHVLVRKTPLGHMLNGRR